MGVDKSTPDKLFRKLRRKQVVVLRQGRERLNGIVDMTSCLKE